LPPNMNIGSSHVRTASAFNSAALTRELAARNEGLFVRASSARRRINSVETTTFVIGAGFPSCAWTLFNRAPAINKMVPKAFITPVNYVITNGHNAPAAIAEGHTTGGRGESQMR